jgi:DNA-binding phage protein
MVNVKKLKSTINNKDSSIDKLALDLGIDRATLYRRLKDGNSFNIGEVAKIKKSLNLSREEAVEIFFGD